MGNVENQHAYSPKNCIGGGWTAGGMRCCSILRPAGNIDLGKKSEGTREKDPSGEMGRGRRRAIHHIRERKSESVRMGSKGLSKNCHQATRNTQVTAETNIRGAWGRSKSRTVGRKT